MENQSHVPQSEHNLIPHATNPRESTLGNHSGMNGIVGCVGLIGVLVTSDIGCLLCKKGENGVGITIDIGVRV